MELRVLRYFLTVAREQSFINAAKQLHITQPTLSRQLAQLEEELGTTLFDRNGHGAAPDSWFSHLAVEVSGENISNEWLEPVSEEDYGKLR